MKHWRKYFITSIAATLTSLSAVGNEIAIKNFREIFESLIKATGVTPTQTHITAYQQVRDALPKFGEIEEYTPAMSLGVLKLSGHFCKSLIAEDAAKPPVQRRAHKEVDFQKPPKEMSESIRMSVIHSYAGLFWQATPASNEVLRLLNLMEKLAASASVTSQGTKDVLLMTCTAVASAVEFLVI